jgi:PIN domain nuclease of toxin-antitoxin system
VIVIDASALVALLRNEPGADVVGQHMDEPVVSAANLAETLTRLVDDGADALAIRQALERSPIVFVPVSADHATAAAQLRTMTKPLGLSLGDRLCLALALEAGLPVLTAERRWANLALPLKIVQIR